LIKNFADADGRVFCMDIQADEVTKPPPKNAAWEAGFNDYLMNGETVSFEDRLEKIETGAAPILRRIVSSLSLSATSPLSSHDCALLMSRFSSSLRSPRLKRALDMGLR
jgi:Protein of unknown function (DUF4238)